MGNDVSPVKKNLMHWMIQTRGQFTSEHMIKTDVPCDWEREDDQNDNVSSWYETCGLDSQETHVMTTLLK
jgi:hypothetical protein